jgi:hypothetical protein
MRRPSTAADLLDGLLRESSSVTLPASEKSAVSTQASNARSAAEWQKTPDHYTLLGVERSVSEEEVRGLDAKDRVQIRKIGCSLHAQVDTTEHQRQAVVQLRLHWEAVQMP